MIKFSEAQLNFISGNYPKTLSKLLRNKALESRDKSSNEYLYVFQEAARTATRIHRNMNRYFETLLCEDLKPDPYYLERSIQLANALVDVMKYFENYKLTDTVKNALRFIEKDEKEGENIVDSMPTDIPLSLALVDPTTGNTELVTLILDSDSDEATIIDENGEMGTVPKDKIKSIQTMDEVPDAIKNVSSMAGANSEDVTPMDETAGFPDEEQAEAETGGEEAPAEGLPEGEYGGEEGLSDLGELGAEEGGAEGAGETEQEEEEEETEKKKEFYDKKVKRVLEATSHSPVNVDMLVSHFNSVYNGNKSYVMEEDVSTSILKGKGFYGKDGDSLLEPDDSYAPINAKIANKEDLAETTFKGGYQGDPPDEAEPIKKRSSDDNEAIAKYKKGSDALKTDPSDFKFENRFALMKQKRESKPQRKLIRYK